MRRSRAGRSGGSWYGSYAVYDDESFSHHTNLESAMRLARSQVRIGHEWSEVIGGHGTEPRCLARYVRGPTGKPKKQPASELGVKYYLWHVDHAGNLPDDQPPEEYENLWLADGQTIVIYTPTAVSRGRPPDPRFQIVRRYLTGFSGL
jgi:hypothetical protein